MATDQETGDLEGTADLLRRDDESVSPPLSDVTATLEALLRIARQPAPGIPQLLDVAVREAVGLTRSMCGLAFQHDVETRQVVLSGWWSRTGVPAPLLDAPATWNVDAAGVWGDAAKLDRPLLVEDLGGDGDAPHVATPGMRQPRRVLAVPVHDAGQVVAVLGLADKPEPYDIRDVAQVSLLMDGVWKLVVRRQSEESLRDALVLSHVRECEVTALLQASRAVLDANTVDDAARAVLWAARDASGAEQGVVTLRHHGGEDERVASDTGRDAKPEATRALRDQVHRSREPVLAYVFDHRPRRLLLEVGPVPQGDALAAPVVLGSEVVGTLVLTHKPEGFTQRDLRLARAFTEFLSVYLRNAQLSDFLLASEARARAVFESTPLPTYLWSAQGEEFVLVDLNRAALQVTPRALGARVGASCPRLPHDHPEDFQDLRHVLHTHQPLKRETDVATRQPGESRRLSLHYGYVAPDMVIVHAEDVTEQRRTEERLRAAQQADAVGRLAAGVAHDINNHLSVMMGGVDCGLDGLIPGEARHQNLMEVKQAAHKVAEMMRQLLAVGRRQARVPVSLDLDRVVAAMEGLVRRVVGEDVVVTVVPSPGLWRARLDPNQVEQVVLNLVANARDAMPEGGSLTLETQNASLDDAYSARHAGAAPGDYVALVVSDTGHGMDASARARLFEPFFSPRGGRNGSGMVLSAVQGIVQQNGGFVWAYSEPGRGSTIKAYFPRDVSPVVTPRQAQDVVGDLRGVETILVVEDDESMRSLCRRVLVSRGYNVLDASNGHEALSAYGDPAIHLDLMVTDVIMPVMGGPSLVGKMRATHPGLRVVYMSGYSDKALERQGTLDNKDHFLNKPFGAREFLLKVREALATAPSAAPTES